MGNLGEGGVGAGIFADLTCYCSGRQTPLGPLMLQFPGERPNYNIHISLAPDWRPKLRLCLVALSSCLLQRVVYQGNPRNPAFQALKRILKRGCLSFTLTRSSPISSAGTARCKSLQLH